MKFEKEDIDYIEQELLKSAALVFESADINHIEQELLKRAAPVEEKVEDEDAIDLHALSSSLERSTDGITLSYLKHILAQLQRQNPEMGHITADAALVAYIHDPEVKRLFSSLVRWYS